MNLLLPKPNCAYTKNPQHFVENVFKTNLWEQEWEINENIKLPKKKRKEFGKREKAKESERWQKEKSEANRHQTGRGEFV